MGHTSAVLCRQFFGHLMDVPEEGFCSEIHTQLYSLRSQWSVLHQFSLSLGKLQSLAVQSL